MIDPLRLKPFALFAQLSDASLARVAEHCTRTHYDRGRMLVAQGAPADRFFLVEYGRVKVYRSGPDGREQVLHIVESWQSFAEVAVLAMATYPASAEALADCACLVVPRDAFLGLLDSDSQAARAMLAGQALWIRRLVDQTTSLALEDVLTRLARYLVVYADTRGIPLEDGAALVLDVKKSLIASQIGTVPETLARNLKKLCSQGVLERTPQGFVVRDARKLNEIAYSSALRP